MNLQSNNRDYVSQICIDFSPAVIKKMSERFAADTGIQCECADVRSLSFSNRVIDIAFDKGTLDAMIFGSPWDPPQMVKENTSNYINEVSRSFSSLRPLPGWVTQRLWSTKRRQLLSLPYLPGTNLCKAVT